MANPKHYNSCIETNEEEQNQITNNITCNYSIDRKKSKENKQAKRTLPNRRAHVPSITFDSFPSECFEGELDSLEEL